MKVFNRYCADFDIERYIEVFKFSFNMQLFIKKGEILIDFLITKIMKLRELRM